MDYQKTSQILKVLGHPVRLKITEGLIKHECNVGKIVKSLGLPQSTISQHLAILRNTGILDIRKEGLKCCYRVVDKRIKKIITILKK